MTLKILKHFYKTRAHIAKVTFRQSRRNDNTETNGHSFLQRKHEALFMKNKNMES